MRFSGGINRPPYETADGYLQSTEKNLKRKIGYAGIVICRQAPSELKGYTVSILNKSKKPFLPGTVFVFIKKEIFKVTHRLIQNVRLQQKSPVLYNFFNNIK